MSRARQGTHRQIQNKLSARRLCQGAGHLLCTAQGLRVPTRLAHTQVSRPPQRHTKQEGTGGRPKGLCGIIFCLLKRQIVASAPTTLPSCLIGLKWVTCSRVHQSQTKECPVVVTGFVPWGRMGPWRPGTGRREGAVSAPGPAREVSGLREGGRRLAALFYRKFYCIFF